MSNRFRLFLLLVHSWLMGIWFMMILDPETYRDTTVHNIVATICLGTVLFNTFISSYTTGPLYDAICKPTQE